MPLYKRIEDEDEEDTINKELEVNKQIVDEEATWKKRYSDLRSHSQKIQNDLNKRILALEKQNSAPVQQALPKTKEEVAAWAEKYPDVYGLVKSIVGLDLEEATTTVNARFETLEQREATLKKEQAEAALLKAHPDFFETIAPSEEFRAWLDTKSKKIQDALYSDELDADAAAEAVSLYKFETGILKNETKSFVPDNRDAARNVRVPANRTPPSANAGDYDYSESQIEHMTNREYEAQEDKIDNARASGRILMDITGGAR